MQHKVGAVAAGLLVVAGVTGATSAVASSPAPSAAPIKGTITYTFAAPGGEDHIFTIGADGSDPQMLVPFSQGGSSWSPDGASLMVPASASDGRITTAMVKPDGSGLDPPAATGCVIASAWTRRLVGGREAHRARRLERQGRQHERAVHAARRTAATCTRSPMSASRATTTSPVAWSPDGAWILYITIPGDGERGPLSIVSADGKKTQRLTPDGQYAWLSHFGPAGTWAPDSAHVAFSAFDSLTGSNSASFLAATDGSAPVQIADWGGYNTGARFSPDGSWVAFDRSLKTGEGDPHQHQLFLVHPDGSGTIQLTHGDTLGVGLCCASWSPDGQSLLFQGGPADDASQLYTIAVDGTAAHQLTIESGSYGNYSWSSYPATGS